jgi:hypothetical protein
MIRTQIQLTERQAERLKATAARRGVSMAELIRQSVDHLLAGAEAPSEKDLRRKAAAAAGRFRSSPGDVSVRHDDYLSDAFAK